MTASPQDLRSTAVVATGRSARWVKQLSEHLGRKAEVREAADGGRLLLLAGGSCLLSGDATTLRFAAQAPDEQVLSRIEHVVGGHFERFAAKEELTVHWRREPA